MNDKKLNQLLEYLLKNMNAETDRIILTDPYYILFIRYDNYVNKYFIYDITYANAEKQYSLDVYVSEDKPELYNELFIAEYYENNKHQHVSRETPEQIFDFIND
jgi:hypothetical protein